MNRIRIDRAIRELLDQNAFRPVPDFSERLAYLQALREQSL